VADGELEQTESLAAAQKPVVVSRSGCGCHHAIHTIPHRLRVAEVGIDKRRRVQRLIVVFHTELLVQLRAFRRVEFGCLPVSEATLGSRQERVCDGG
jgi:hypothetical protein